MSEISSGWCSSRAGVELGLDERTYLQSVGIEAHPNIEMFRTKWDIIMMFHVFEHLSEPEDILHLLCNNLQDDGRIIIEIPNGNDALLSLYKSTEFADFTYWSAHVFLYTVQGFKYLIDKVGIFDIDKIEYVQRYPLANHLYWLTNGKPGGQDIWTFLDDEDINKKYKELLAEQGLCYTPIFTLKKKYGHE